MGAKHNANAWAASRYEWQKEWAIALCYRHLTNGGIENQYKHELVCPNQTALATKSEMGIPWQNEIQAKA